MDLNRLASIAEKNCHLNRNQPILVGVSGGPDSLCLLDVLNRLRFSLIVAHFDHQLRMESADDSSKVEATARQFGLPFYLGRQDVAAYADEQHFSIEEAARVLRYRFLFSLARELHVQAVAVGHTADDQVETVLMHILRGSGLTGLHGMAQRSIFPGWDKEIPLVRPLLSFWREEITAYCRDHDLEPIMDVSNLDPSFLRNRLRHELIPYLETYNPQIRKTLWRMSRVMAGEEAAAQQFLEPTWAACLVSQREGAVLLKANLLRTLSPGLIRAVLRKAITILLPALRDVDFNTVERVEHLLANSTPGMVDLVQGLRVFIEEDTLVIHKTGITLLNPFWPQVGFIDPVRLEIPGLIDLPSDWCLTSHWVDWGDLPDVEASKRFSPWEAWLDSAHIPGQLFLRRPNPGDRFQPYGMDGHSVKLSDFWINQKHPRRARDAWPLIVSENQILWVPGFRLAHLVRIQENTRKALHLRMFRVFAELESE